MGAILKLQIYPMIWDIKKSCIRLIISLKTEEDIQSHNNSDTICRIKPQFLLFKRIYSV